MTDQLDSSKVSGETGSQPRWLAILTVVAAALALVGVVSVTQLVSHKTVKPLLASSSSSGPALGSVDLPQVLKDRLQRPGPSASGVKDQTTGEFLAKVNTPAGELRRIVVHGTVGDCWFIYLVDQPAVASLACGHRDGNAAQKIGVQRAYQGSEPGYLSGQAVAGTTQVRLSATGETTVTIPAYDGGSDNGGLAYFLTTWSASARTTVEALGSDGSVLATAVVDGLSTGGSAN